MIRGLAHTAFVVEDMEKSLHFYCGVLGFKRLFELNRDNKPWIVYLKICDKQFLELFYGGETKNEVKMGMIGYNHLCLEVEDIHEIADHLRKNGIALDVEPKQGMDLNYQCWVRDPDGNRIEFMQYHPDCPQLK